MIWRDEIKWSSYGLILVVLNLFLSGKSYISNNALTEIYRNLSSQGLSKKDPNVEINFDAITELVPELSMRLKNTIVSNRQGTKIEI